MELVEPRPNVEIRRGDGGAPVVALNFPYDPHVVQLVRRIPGRRFDWESREWSAPVDDWVGVHVLEVLKRFPELTTSEQAKHWLAGIAKRWIGTVSTQRFDGRGWFALRTRAGDLPEELAAVAVEQPLLQLVPMTEEVADVLDGQRGAKVDSAAQRCIAALRRGETPPPARLTAVHGVDGEHLKLDVLWDPETGEAFERLPGAGDRSRTMPVDPWVVEHLDAFIAAHDVEVTSAAQPVIDDLRAEHAEASAAIRRSKATQGDPIEGVRLGGTLEPFQWAGVRYVLDARRSFLADEQGLGKTVEALAALEADGAFPAVVVCPASLKLNWRRETARWLPHRTVAVLEGRSGGDRVGEADITILNYEVVAARLGELARTKPAALVVDEAHYAKNPRAKRTQAVRRLAEAVTPGGLRLALTGTPVLNHAEELISQLRIIGRLEDFGSGARFSRQFQGPLTEERLHWHLRRRCFVRRLKKDVLPQLPAKRQVVVPVELENLREYRKAEQDVVAWLREQPLDLGELNAQIASTLRAERLAQLGVLQRLAAQGKLPGALAWVHDFLENGEPLVLFARHVAVQDAVMARFPDALHILGRDSVEQREAAVQAFQDPDGPLLIVCATRVAAQGITLTRASNVAFLELEWTPAMHDQAEDRVHRIGQDDAVTAYYLLAAETIDETMAEVLQAKRGVIQAVTEGTRMDEASLVEQVVAGLRDEGPYRRLKAVS